MPLENLDRTQWFLNSAIDHVANQILRANPPSPEAIAAAEALPLHAPNWMRARSPEAIARSKALQEVQIALRDGDLHAKGRLSTTPSAPWRTSNQPFEFHSGHYSSISPEQWCAGQANLEYGTLLLKDAQFIEIRTPRFMVLAIWPEVPEPVAEAGVDPETGAPYTTPYLDLLTRAIAEMRVSNRDQCKKELLSDWFRSQLVNGEPVSQNLADAMATLVRQPASQRGGARRIF